MNTSHLTLNHPQRDRRLTAPTRVGMRRSASGAKVTIATTLTTAACFAAFGWTTAAHAQAAGDIVLNAGWFHLAPQDSSHPLKVSALGTTATKTGSGASVDNSNTGGVTLNYFVTDNIAVEGVFGYPPKMQLDGNGTLAPLGKLGSAKEWSPALLLKYYFGKADSTFRPYVGAGVSYVWYSDVKLEPALATGAFLQTPQTGSLLTGRTTADLSSSFAPVFNAGITYNFSKHWSANFSVSYLTFSTKATLTTQSAAGTVRSETRLRINPLVTFASIGYKF